MPRAIIYTKERVLDAAFDIVQRSGLHTLSARSIAKKLESSTAPVYSYFNSMEDVEKAIFDKIRDVFVSYVNKSFTEHVFLNNAIGLVLFARDCPMFFRAIFIESDEYKKLRRAIIDSTDRDLKVLPALSDATDADRRDFLRKLEILAHGLALQAAADLLDDVSDEYIIYSLWEIAEEYIQTVCKRPAGEKDCVVVGGLRVAKDKVEKLTAWRKQQSAVDLSL